MAPSPLSRRWCFTWNNYQDHEADGEILKGVLQDRVKVRYAIVGKEGNFDGTPHLQGYISFSKPVRLSALKKLCSDKIHWEIAQGNEQQNYDYCSKEGDFTEYGTRTIQGKRTDLQGAIAAVKSGVPIVTIADEFPSTYIKYGRGLKDLRLVLQDVYDHDGVRGLWLYGPPGSGKSHVARQIAGEHLFLKAQNKWWDGYNGEHVVVLDDLDTSTLGHHLKIWADRYACTGETKGGTIHLQHRMFIVTSNYPPSRLFHEDEMMCAAIERRFKTIYKESRDTIVDHTVYIPKDD